MKSDGRVCHIFIEGDRGGCYVERVDVEAGPGLQAVYDRFLYFFLRLDAIATT
jgi:hypothetical protein